jgi:hypothetical protein
VVEREAAARPTRDTCGRLGLALLRWWGSSAVYFDSVDDQDLFVSSVCEVRDLVFEISNSDKDCALPFAQPEHRSEIVPFSFPMIPYPQADHGLQQSAWKYEQALALWVSNAATPDLSSLQRLMRIVGVQLRIVAMVGVSAHDTTAGLFFKDKQAKVSQHDSHQHDSHLSWALGEAYRLGMASLMVQLRTAHTLGAAVRLLRVHDVGASLDIRRFGAQRAADFMFPELRVHSPPEPTSGLFTVESISKGLTKTGQPSLLPYSIHGNAGTTTTFLFIAGLEGTGHHLLHQLWTKVGILAASDAATDDEACSAKIPRMCFHRKLSMHLQSMFGSLGNSTRQKHAVQFQHLVRTLTAADAQSGKERKVYILNTVDPEEMLSFPFGNRLATAKSFPGTSCFRLQGRSHCAAHPDLILLDELVHDSSNAPSSQLKCILLARQLGASVVSTSVSRHFGGRGEIQAHVLAASYRLMVHDLRVLFFSQAEGELGGSAAFLQFQYDSIIADSGRAAAGISNLLHLSTHESDMLVLEFRNAVGSKISQPPTQNEKNIEDSWKKKLEEKAMQIVHFVGVSLSSQAPPHLHVVDSSRV